MQMLFTVNYNTIVELSMQRFNIVKGFSDFLIFAQELKFLSKLKISLMKFNELEI